MNPVDIFRETLRVNRPVAVFLLAGACLLALATMILNFIGDAEATLTIALWILGLAFVVTVLTFAIGNPLLRASLGWTFFGCFVLFLAGFVDSAMQITKRLPVPVCYVRMLIQHPDHCLREHFPSQQVALVSGSRFAFFTGPERLWLTGDEPLEPRVPPYPGPIYIQVAPGVDAATPVSVVDTLTDLGWPTVGGIKGVDYVRIGPRNSEVRYFDPGQREDAWNLARALKQALPDRDIYVSDFTKSGRVARAGLLEIWISPAGTNG